MPAYRVQEGADGALQVQLDELRSGTGPLRIVRGADTPANEPVLHMDLSGQTGPNLLEARGSETGFYWIWITDTCAIVTNGQIQSNARWSPGNGVSPLVGGRAYNFGASDDWLQNAEKQFALYIGESNHVDQDYFQGFLTNEVGHRFRIGRLGELGWSDGATVESDILVVRQAASVLEVRLGVAHSPALRIAEAGVDETALLLRRNLAGVFTLQRVSQGAVDSGGAGFRLLRIPN